MSSTTTAARRRLMRDFKRLQEDPPMGVSAAPCENNIMKWNAVIFGPVDTPFEDGTFKLMISKLASKITTTSKLQNLNACNLKI